MAATPIFQMEQLTVIAEIARVSSLTLLTWALSGLWADVFLLRRLVPEQTRGSLLLACGVATHMILTLNLSYLGIAVNRGLWISLLIALAPLLFRLKQLPGILPPARCFLPALIFAVLAISTHTWSLVKERVVTTSPAENGDWLTYVSHADILKDYGYGYTRAQTEYPVHYIHTEQYETANFRYGPSHLLASSSAITGSRAIYIFTIFCACLLAVIACSMYALALQLRIGSTISLILAILWSIHPSVQWVAFAAFMPQLVGIATMLTIFSLAHLALSPKPKVISGAALGLFTCALFVGYNELLPLTGASVGLYSLAVVRLKQRRWRRLLLTGGVILAVTALLSPIGVYRGILGMMLQIKIAQSTGGGDQAIQEYLFFFSSWLGYLPLPPIRPFIDSFRADPRFQYAQLAATGFLLVSLGLTALGASRSLRGRRGILLAFVLVAAVLGTYIQLTFPIPQFRTWALFKLSQYALHIVALLIAIGILTLRTPGRALGTLLVIGITLQGAYYYSTFPRVPLRQANQGFGISPTTIDMELVEAVSRVVPGGKPVFALNDFSSARDVSAQLLLYPRQVLNYRSDVHHFFASGGRYGVQAKRYPEQPIYRGKVVWENERFSLVELHTEQIYLSLADTAAKTIGPESRLVVPSCKPGDHVALLGFAPEGGLITASLGQEATQRPKEFEVKPGEFILQLRAGCEAGGTQMVLRTAARIFAVDSELVRGDLRVRRLAVAAESLAAGSTPLMNMLPPLGASSAWQTRLFDGSKAQPTIERTGSGIKLTSKVASSGGLESIVNLSGGWYELNASAVIPHDLTGSGRGFGIGFLDLPESQYWRKTSGEIEVSKLIHVPQSGPRGLGLILGGYGTVTGEVIVNRLELKPVRYLSSPTRSSAIPLAPWTDSAWSKVSYDGAKDLCEHTVSGPSLRLSSAKLTSSGLGTVVDLQPGAYILSAQIAASVPAVGSGLGYAVLLEGQPESIISRKDVGIEMMERAFWLSQGGRYRISVLIGGFGLSHGAAQFSDIRLQKVGEIRSASQKDEVNSVSLPDVGSERWRVVNLDPSPGVVNVGRGDGWISLGSDGQISSAAVTEIRLEKGAYILGTDVIANESAVGGGRGYGVGLLQNQRFQWWVREKGSHRITALMLPERRVEDAMAFIVGGFGTVKGTARFSQPVIRPLRYSSLADVK